MELRADPQSLAPERILVLEVNGSISSFYEAARRVIGLEFIAEQELVDPDVEEQHTLYLFVPDEAALKQITSLWRRWTKNQNLGVGFTPWRDVFSHLADVRPWGPQDRVDSGDAEILRRAVDESKPGAPIRLEVELAPFSSEGAAIRAEGRIQESIVTQGGRVLHRSRISDIAYHALLVELPSEAVERILDLSQASLAGSEPVLHIRPQSVANAIGSEERADGEVTDHSSPRKPPIAALVDGVPISEHPALQGRLSIDDVFELSGIEPEDRRHGTAMASLITRGDLNVEEPALPRRLHVVPVLGEDEQFPENQLIVDVIWRAIRSIKEGEEPAAPDVLIVNLSLGNSNRPFHSRPSAWARLLDRLAYEYGILFVVSAGNVMDEITLPELQNGSELESAEDLHISRQTLKGLASKMADRKIFSPAETLNGLTVGAANHDAEPNLPGLQHREPYKGLQFANPSSALGPGIGGATKPDILMPGGKERIRFTGNTQGVRVAMSVARRGAGLKVAAPPRQGDAFSLGYSGCTSGATALTTRACHQIHDALEEAFGEDFTSLPSAQRATLLKALIGHSARWKQESSDLVREIVGPPNGRHHQRQRDNIRRFLGLGWADNSIALSCVDDRATFWACGEIDRDEQRIFDVPIPACIDGIAMKHRVAATLAWFSPVSPGRQAYRAVRLEIIKPDALDLLGVKNAKEQPDENQSLKGTLVSRHWEGDKAPKLAGHDSFELRVQRKPDQGVPIDEPIPFGLAVTLEMAGAVEIYQQVRTRVAPRVPIT